MASGLHGAEDQIAALQGIAARILAATPEGLSQAAKRLEMQVKLELSRTSHAPGTPTPSPPGSPPSMVSGRLHRSYQVEGPTQTGGYRFTAQVGSDLVYSAVHELGGNHLPARPHMAPALATALPEMGAFIEQAWADALG